VPNVFLHLPNNPLFVFNQHRIFRVFQLLSSLRSQPPKDTRYLCQLLGTSERTIYRYFDLLKKAGFDVRVDSEGRYAIMGSDLAPYLMLSDEEASYLAQVLAQSPAGDPMSETIRTKLGLIGKTASAAEWIHQGKISRFIQLLTTAMTEKRQVMLKLYHSANSGTISNRLVEPVAFTDHYQSISAYEPSTRTNKYFNLERMEDIEILDAPQCNESAHIFRRPDVFGFAITKPTKIIHISLELAPFLYLRRHFPMARPFIVESNVEGRYELQTTVGSYVAPAGLFRLFPNQVHAIGDAGFRRYLKRDMSKWNDSE
jgi:predicted DNA-binding transcriptional regulator YafY